MQSLCLFRLSVVGRAVKRKLPPLAKSPHFNPFFSRWKRINKRLVLASQTELWSKNLLRTPVTLLPCRDWAKSERLYGCVPQNYGCKNPFPDPLTCNSLPQLHASLVFFLVAFLLPPVFCRNWSLQIVVSLGDSISRVCKKTGGTRGTNGGRRATQTKCCQRPPVMSQLIFYTT